ncbi:MAG TPA: hypothetical protein VLZ75_00855 [Chitinophagales bacterium]|nr:hypothetical protein [Chitinophagales bacterium]
MDIKIALGKIEQYWQIIRNLHFHIEQEGHISQEEYALIEKYLKVITQKYKDLVLEEECAPIAEVGIDMGEPQPIIEEIKQEIIETPISKSIVEEEILLPKSTEENIESVQETSTIETIEETEILPVEEELVSETLIEKDEEIVPEEITSDIVAEEKEVELIEEPIFENDKVEEETLSSQVEEIFPEIAPEAPKHHKISSYLEQMLDSPDDVPNTPMFFNVRQEPTKSTSLNDKLKEMRSPVEDINSRIKRATADKISLNDKFEFIKDLFGNNPIEYAAAIQQFDTYGSMIWGNVEREFSTKFNWASKPATVQKLKTLVTGK